MANTPQIDPRPWRLLVRSYGEIAGENKMDQLASIWTRGWQTRPIFFAPRCLVAVSSREHGALSCCPVKNLFGPLVQALA